MSARVDVGPALLAAVLAPYKPHCRYVLAASVHQPVPGTAGHRGAPHDVAVLDEAASAPALVLDGELEIPASCYIDETGHFNSVEFNLCFNQLFYVGVAQAVVSGLLPALGGMTLDEYLRRQLPDVLIHDFQSVFKKALTAKRFRGRLTFESVADRRRFVHFRTRCEFHDDGGGHAEGRVTLVMVDSAGATAAAAAARAAR